MQNAKLQIGMHTSHLQQLNNKQTFAIKRRAEETNLYKHYFYSQTPRCTCVYTTTKQQIFSTQFTQLHIFTPGIDLEYLFSPSHFDHLVIKIPAAPNTSISNTSRSSRKLKAFWKQWLAIWSLWRSNNVLRRKITKQVRGWSWHQTGSQ